MGKYDLPACFDHVLKINKMSNKIIYIGHSQGGTSLLSALALNYEYMKSKLLAVVLLSPASRVTIANSKVLKFAVETLNITDKFKDQQIFEILPHNEKMLNFNNKINKYYPSITFASVEAFSDEHLHVNCSDRLKIYFSRFPSGSSVKSTQHFAQLLRDKKFQQFDYGKEKNNLLYLQETPLEYDLSNIKKLPIILCAGQNDKLISIEDIRWLKDELKENIYRYHEFETMGHISYFLSCEMLWFNYILADLYNILNGTSKKDKNEKDNIEPVLHEVSTAENSPLKTNEYERRQTFTQKDEFNLKPISNNSNIDEGINEPKKEYERRKTFNNGDESIYNAVGGVKKI